MNQRRRLTGIVTSNRMMKTVVVEVSRTYQHPLYRKVVHSRQKVKAHDENNDAKAGDKVKIIQSRPISREKCWQLLEIVEKAK